MRKGMISLLLAITAVSAPAQEQCSSLVHRALETYGCIDALKAYPAQLQRQINGQLERNRSMSEEDRKRVSEAISRNTSSDRLIQSVETRLSDGCNPAELESFLTEIRSPLVQKMRAFEAAPQTPETSAQLEKNFSANEAQPPSETRKKLIQELMDATDTTNVMVNTIVETSRGMVEGMGAPPAESEQIAHMRQRIHDNTAMQMTNMMLAIYHDATDDELRQYLELQQKPQFRHFNASFSEAMIAGMGLQARSAGAAMREVLNQIKADQEKAQPQPPAPKK